MLDRFHPPVEEYLETIYALEEEGIPVIQARLAERLEKAAPSVSEMLDRLEADGLITRRGRRIALTPAGLQLATGVVRKHRLAERLLVDVIGLDWEKAHAEAGRWEHVISDDVEARLVALLDDPATCPHGNPIPPRESARGDDAVVVPLGERSAATSLAEVDEGAAVTLTRIAESVEHDASSLHYLGEHGFIPGTTAQVTAKAPDGTLTLSVGGGAIALGPVLACRLFVEVHPAVA